MSTASALELVSTVQRWSSVSHLWLCASQRPGVNEPVGKGGTSIFITQNKPIRDLGLGSMSLSGGAGVEQPPEKLALGHKISW